MIDDGNEIVRGSDVSMRLTLSASGFDPRTDDWQVAVIIGGRVRALLTRRDAVIDAYGITLNACTNGWPC